MGGLDISFILPVIDETTSLRATVEAIFRLSGDQVREVVVVVSDETISGSRDEARRLEGKYPGTVRIIKQNLPGLGGAIREAFEAVKGEEVMLMSSDLETDPEAIPGFIHKMREGKWDVVIGSRWLSGGGFSGYGLVKQVLNYGFQRLVALLYGVKLTDLTFAYRLYRRKILLGVEWEELGYPFLLECILRPVRAGARVAEVPCRWRSRVEGVSHGSWWQRFRYVGLAIRLRWYE